jgi:hypothetical protein
MVLDIQTVHDHILKNTAVQNVNKPFVYITDLASTLIILSLKFHTTIKQTFAAFLILSLSLTANNFDTSFSSNEASLLRAILCLSTTVYKI